MDVVFMGTPAFAVPVLEALVGGGARDGGSDTGAPFSVRLVITRPDAASSRGKALLPSPVRRCADGLGIPVVTPRSFYAYADGSAHGAHSAHGSTAHASDPARVPLFDVHGQRVADAGLLARIAATEPDFIIVAAYGMVLPPQVLRLPRLGCVNVHASLLPRWRGAAPIQRAILAGDERLGVSIMRMEEGLDTGAYCAVATTPAEGKNARELTAELACLGAKLLVDALPCIADGSAEWREQDEGQVTYADKVTKHELALDPADSALVNLRRILASTPQTPARCVLADKPVTVLEARLWEGESGLSGAPAAPVSLIGKRLVLATADGALELITLKPDGRKEMPASAFAAGVKELQRGGAGFSLWRALA